MYDISSFYFVLDFGVILVGDKIVIELSLKNAEIESITVTFFGLVAGSDFVFMVTIDKELFFLFGQGSNVVVTVNYFFGEKGRYCGVF